MRRRYDLETWGRDELESIVASTLTAVARHAHAVLPVHGEAREAFSPVLYHLFADYVASYLAGRLGRALFQGDRPALLRSVNEYYARLQQEEGFTAVKKEATMEKR